MVIYTKCFWFRGWDIIYKKCLLYIKKTSSAYRSGNQALLFASLLLLHPTLLCCSNLYFTLNKMDKFVKYLVLTKTSKQFCASSLPLLFWLLKAFHIGWRNWKLNWRKKDNFKRKLAPLWKNHHTHTRWASGWFLLVHYFYMFRLTFPYYHFVHKYRQIVNQGCLYYILNTKH